jgi:Kdo2-lipid IVA lauroyltransferase/acyltransferase
MYYLIYVPLYLLSLLPLRVLYLLSDAVYGLLYHIIGYRKKVVMDNLQIAFPEKTVQERVLIAKKFYHNFIDTFIETIKMFSASEAYLRKRVSGNWEVFQQLYDTGRSCQVHLGHTFNWEWANSTGVTQMKYVFIGVYMPITNKTLDKIFYDLRSKTGTVMLPATDMRKAMIPYRNTLYALGLVADQAPGNPSKAYWLNFFNKPTPFVMGPEKGARAGNLPVIFATIEKPKRGYYKVILQIAEENPASLAEGELTVRYARYVEEVIRRNPDMWLWSHRRWKREWSPEYKDLWIDIKSPV